MTFGINIHFKYKVLISEREAYIKGDTHKVIQINEVRRTYLYFWKYTWPGAIKHYLRSMAKICELLVSVALVYHYLSMVNAATLPPPSIFILGDSTVDVGTNNFLSQSEAKADSLPNGIDFPNALPTGRFSNGLNSADQIGMQHSIN